MNWWMVLYIEEKALCALVPRLKKLRLVIVRC